MQVAYCLLCILIIWNVIKKDIDFVSVFAISFILYSSNCAIGTVRIGQAGVGYQGMILFETYEIICMQLFIILFYLWKKDTFRFNTIKNIRIHFPRFSKRSNKNDFYWISMALVSTSYIIFVIFFDIGVSTFFSYTHKVEIMEKISIFFGLSIWGGMIGFFHFIMMKKKRLAFISSAGVIASFLLGSRAYIACACIGLLIFWSFNCAEKINNHGRLKVILGGMLLFLVMVIYKLIYQEVRAGDLFAIVDILSNPDTWVNAINIAELRIVCTHYNYIVENQIALPSTDVVARLSSIIPFLNHYVPSVYPIRFSALLMMKMNAVHGLASNFWGEVFAMGGRVAVFFSTIISLVVIEYMSKKVRDEKSPFMMIAVSYLSFYIHRLDWTQVMGCLKMTIMFYFVKLLFDSIVFEKRF